MKAKYKLIKQYPGCRLELNDVVEWQEAQNALLAQYRCKNKDIGVGGVDVSEFPEFWEKVEEKDYQVLLVENENNEVWKFNDGGYFLIGSVCLKLESEMIDCIKYGNFTISSVKRLSDGKIFSIGDTVQDKLTDKLTNYSIQKINHFYYGDKIICQAESGTTMPLSTIRHSSCLFITEDGVEIKEGDSCYAVCDNFNILHTDFILSDYERNGKVRSFSTKEKAQEFVINNKPCLSLEDIRKVKEKIPYFGEDFTGLVKIYIERMNKLKELVEERIL